MKRLFALLVCLCVFLAPVVSDGRGGRGGRSGGSSYSGKSHSTGSVNVKGYYRKDGTYVAPHTRSNPGESHSSSSSQSSSRSSLKAHRAPSSYYLMSAPGARDSNGRLVRNEAAKREFLGQTGYPHGRPGYVVDHIVPLKRGGCDCPANMQWQTVEEAKAKDKSE